MRTETILISGTIGLILLGWVIVASEILPRRDDAPFTSQLTVHPNTSTLTSDVIAVDDTFLFERSSGHFETGFDRLQIRGNGQVKMLVHVQLSNPRSIEPRLATFTLTDDELARLGYALRSAHFAEMPDGYSTNLCDAAFLSMLVACQGKRKNVSCSDYISDELLMLDDYISQHVIAPHRDEADNAQPIPWEEVEQRFQP
ncbi:hypothetical protein DTL21_06355 [Bremerella cremea]|uniref:Uncharacterized protein n=1 Tax=Blastopirellula marina TaxID=124 RepID=A0A2S8FZF2_9BACT|nr:MULTISPECIES: hypothetical protein [Pirellulaceae]PQO37563.1 hypothetical protein C5Y83_06355 [Blastopirellula marina]RCS49950.1 hypothetical protein DTL21_06355 [Bremerella cremea]